PASTLCFRLRPDRSFAWRCLVEGPPVPNWQRSLQGALFMKTRFVALAVAATMGLGSVSAFAQDHHRDGRGQGAWQHQRADQGRGDWSHNNRYYDGRGYRRDDDSGNFVGAMVLGALAGALVGQV